MKEYIEREAAIKKLNDHLHAMIDDAPISQGTKDIYEMAYRHVEDVLRKLIPAADVVEVRHGIPDPIEETYEDTDGAHVYRHIVGYACPFCGSDRIAKYCADCGAKMDGGADDDDN